MGDLDKNTLPQRPGTRSFLSGALGALVVLIAALFVVPQYSDYRAQARANDALIAIRPLQDLITSRAITLGTVSGSGSGVAATTAPSIEEMVVHADGTIVVLVSRFGVVLVLTPTYSGGKVSWRCIGGSAKDVPAQCRHRP